MTRKTIQYYYNITLRRILFFKFIIVSLNLTFKTIFYYLNVEVPQAQFEFYSCGGG